MEEARRVKERSCGNNLTWKPFTNSFILAKINCKTNLESDKQHHHLSIQMAARTKREHWKLILATDN